MFEASLQRYDVVIVGGGIAGSVAARISSENGLNTLLLEREATPRNKVCSGVQLSYMEKLLGAKIPVELLCSNTLNRVELTTPVNTVWKVGLKMINFWRADFDDWLNKMAVENGAEFRDETNVTGFQESKDGILVQTVDGEIETRYLVGADGLSPSSITRKTLTPFDFSDKTTATAINYYFEGETDVDPGTLYIFFNKEFSDLMFSWLYYKDEQLVIGTSSSSDIREHADRFYNYVKDRFNLKGKITRSEGYITTYDGFTAGTFLGKGNILLVGDAAGFLDLYRGVGMDSAAISGRMASRAIIKADEKGTPVLQCYKELSQKLVNKVMENKVKRDERYRSDKTLIESFSFRNIVSTRLYMAYAQVLNPFLEPEKLILLP